MKTLPYRLSSTLQKATLNSSRATLDFGREEDAKEDLADGLRVLRELTEDYPNPKYAARVSYLRGQFAQELKNWSEAIEAYEDIIRNHGDNSTRF